jgi:hypothetical protein
MTDTSQAEQPREPSAPSAAERVARITERAGQLPLENVHRDARLDIRDNDKDFSSAADAAEEVRRRRKETQANRDYRDAENFTDKIQWGAEDDPGASGTLSDTKLLAEKISEYRENRQALAEKYLTEQYGTDEQQDAVADNLHSEQPQQLTERQQAEEQVRQQQAAAALQEQAEALRQIEQAKQLQAAYAQQIQAVAQQLGSAQNTEFSDIRTHQDILRLAQTDPARHARFMDLNARYSQAHEEYQRVAQAQQQLATIDAQRQQQAADDWRAEQDEQFARAHPEWKNPDTKEREQRQVFEYLESRGLSMQQIEHLYTHDPNFRSAAGQNVLLDATRYWHAQKKAAQISARRLPPVQKPGVASDRGQRDHEHLAALDSRLEKTGNLRHAADLLRARRRAAR